MRVLTIACGVALVPMAVAAQDVFGTETGCSRLAGEPYLTDDAVVWFQGEEIEFHETSCPIMDATQVGGGATLLTVQCSGEGATWEAFYMIVTTSDPDRFVLYPEDSPNFPTEIARCP